MNSTKQVLAGLERMAERSARRASRDYRCSLVDPALAAIRRAGGADGALRALGPGLVEKLDESKLADAMGAATLQAAGIGHASAALPGGD